MTEKELIVYRDIPENSILKDMTWLMDHYTEHESVEKSRTLFYDCMHRLIEQAAMMGFYGNLWHCYLTDLLVNNENAYSRACEIRGAIGGTIDELVLHDISAFRKWFRFDFSEMCDQLYVREFMSLTGYRRPDEDSHVYNTRIRDRICSLSCELGSDASVGEEDDESSSIKMKEALTLFYKEYGVGRFGLHKAFRVSEDKDGEAVIVPIRNIRHVYMDDLVGYDEAKRELIDNTVSFIEGRPANNCLLYGEAGTGKSSSIKAISNEYYDRGLRMIEIYKYQFKDLNSVISQIKDRNYRFIIYMDDLSFEEFETEYKYLKAVIEGGLEKKPSNVLIYATSNRRHLVRENYSDNADKGEDMHTGDTVQEKLSLSDRFGVRIYFGSPDKSEYDDIVLELAKRNNVNISEEELLKGANAWEIGHGGKSGRTAQQYIDHLLGKQEEKTADSM